jgi:NADH dehydrogenase (ubiquinone) 1 alpha subcomplex subunit 2
MSILSPMFSDTHINNRQFVVAQYPELKKNNPDLPILIRECVGTPARAFARFGEVAS